MLFFPHTLLWSSMDSKCGSRAQKDLPGHSCRERMATCVQLSGTASGLWSDTLGGCSLQCVDATQFLRWPHQLGYGNAATLLNISVSLGLCCSATIIDLQYFLLWKESMSFGVKLQKLDEYIRRSCNWFQSSNYCSRLCIFLHTPEILVSFLTRGQGWNMSNMYSVLYIYFFVFRDTISIVQVLGAEPVLYFLWNTACHMTLTMADTHNAWFVVCDFEMEFHEVRVVLLSLKELVAVWWHMDNPTRNQSLHSYCGNRWANMSPGGCPYYSGATGPPGDNRARWNWGVVTTEWTGNELLQDKWAATWEMRKSSHKE